MKLDKLYKLQAELDNHIWDKHKILEKMTKEELLDNTILALLVEVGELANTTRCFKHWSTKGMMKKEIVLEELADVWHFYLSIGNQLRLKYNQESTLIGTIRTLSNTFKSIYYWISKLGGSNLNSHIPLHEYQMIGLGLQILMEQLGFTDKEVEQAYLKKHEENYRRQEEGY